MTFVTGLPLFFDAFHGDVCGRGWEKDWISHLNDGITFLTEVEQSFPFDLSFSDNKLK